MYYRELFEQIRLRPNMFFSIPSFEAVVAFLNGYDEAWEGGLLCGFREWLVLERGCEESLSWSAIVKLLAMQEYGEKNGGQGLLLSWDEFAINKLFALFGEFDLIRVRRDGVGDIFFDYFMLVNSK